MQSKKRFTEINIWEAAFFMDFTSDQKLFFYYINDRCDNIGVWDPNYKLVGFQLSMEGVSTFADIFLKAINKDRERIKILESGAWQIIEFVRFQYCQKKPLNENSPAHQSYLKLMSKRNLLEWFCKEQPEVMPQNEIYKYLENNKIELLKKTSKRPLTEGSESYKDKEKEKDADKGIDRDMDTDKDTAPFGDPCSNGIDLTDKALFGKPALPKTLYKNDSENPAEFEYRSQN